MERPVGSVDGDDGSEEPERETVESAGGLVEGGGGTTDNGGGVASIAGGVSECDCFSRDVASGGSESGMLGVDDRDRGLASVADSSALPVGFEMSLGGAGGNSSGGTDKSILVECKKRDREISSWLGRTV